MRKALLFLAVVALLASCGSKTPTWEDVYKMVDSGEYKSKIDETIKEIGPQTHPASQEVLRYFDYFIKGDLPSAWALVENNSPFMTTRKNLEEFEKSYKVSRRSIDYKSVRVTSLQIKKEMAGVRMVKVGFVITSFDKQRDQEVEMEGFYTMSNLTGQWLIFSSD